MTTVRGPHGGKILVIQFFGMNENPVGKFGVSVKLIPGRVKQRKILIQLKVMKIIFSGLFHTATQHTASTLQMTSAQFSLWSPLT
jgi:hypothetical protein